MDEGFRDLDDLRGLVENSYFEGFPGDGTSFPATNIVKGLIERVEGLEKEKEFFKRNLVKAKANEVVLRNDSQRYKQALEEIESGESVLFTPYYERLWKVLNIARKALKGMK